MKIKAIELLSNNIIETELSFLIGTTQLTFQKSDIQHPNYHLAFDIPNNELEEAYNWLDQRTTALPVTDDSSFSSFEAWNAKSFYFYDNNENLLELICRFDADNQSSASFDSDALLFVSEIGIVTADVSAMGEELITKYGLEY